MIDAPRRAAFDLLVAVREEDAYANLRWPRILKEYGLVGRDAAFATDLAYGTLRWRGLYDAILASVSSRPWKDVDPALVDTLRLGAHQLLAMRVPSHAAVDSSCELARAIGYEDAGRIGFVNGLLRAVAKHDKDEWIGELTQGASSDAAVGIATSHPEWIVAAIREALSTSRGAKVDPKELREALDADNVPARPTLALRDGAESVDLVEQNLTAGRFCARAATLASGLPGEVPLVRDGRAIVQDEGSQLVVQALLAVPVDPPEAAWLDMCAGPGGKAVLLADAAQRAGVDLQAVELHEHRAELIRNLVGAAPIAVAVGDARERPWGSRFFDRILIDAPCTGIGALRRRPESRWRRTPEVVPQLASVQRQLLEVGISSLRTGGVLAYVTCSPHVAETLDVVEDVVMRRDDVEVLDAREFLPQVPDVGTGPHVQLWPHLHGTDAMHLSLMKRR